MSNDELVIEHLPSSDAGIDELCRFAASFAMEETPSANEDAELALTELRASLHGLYRGLYWSLHQGPDDYRRGMLTRVEDIRRVLHERSNANPACDRARKFCEANNSPAFLPLWTAVNTDDEDAFVVQVFFIIRNIPGSKIHSKLLRISRDLDSVLEMPNSSVIE